MYTLYLVVSCFSYIDKGFLSRNELTLGQTTMVKNKFRGLHYDGCHLTLSRFTSYRNFCYMILAMASYIYIMDGLLEDFLWRRICSNKNMFNVTPFLWVPINLYTSIRGRVQSRGVDVTHCPVPSSTLFDSEWV